LPVNIAEDKFSDEDICLAVKECNEHYGRRFSEAEYEEWRKQDKNNRPQIETVRMRLGSMPKLKNTLGIDTYERHAAENIDITKEYCLSAVKKFVSEMLSNENYQRWAKKNNMPAYTTVLSKTGMTWGELKQFAIQE